MSDEHIFADAIGGGLAFSVKTDQKRNSDLGATVDSRFVKSLLVTHERMKHGITSESGQPAEWTVRGVTDRGHPIQTTFSQDKTVKSHYLKPVKKGTTPGQLHVPCTKEQRDDLVAKMSKNGKLFSIQESDARALDPVNVTITEDLRIYDQGLRKIAFLATYKFIGDLFLEDPKIGEWHRALDPELEVAAQAAITELPLSTTGPLQPELLLPALQPFEHAVVVFALPNVGLIAVVRLFNQEALSRAIVMSRSTFGCSALQGTSPVCNARSRQMRNIDVASMFAQNLRRRFHNPI